jgi:hypothetical protein
MSTLARALAVVAIGAVAMHFFESERGGGRRARGGDRGRGRGAATANNEQGPAGRGLSQDLAGCGGTIPGAAPDDDHGKTSEGSAGPAGASGAVHVAELESSDTPTAGRYSDAQWRAMVSRAAYFRAERRGFAGGTPRQDWLAAEEELRRMLRDGGSPAPKA